MYLYTKIDNVIGISVKMTEIGLTKKEGAFQRESILFSL